MSDLIVISIAVPKNRISDLYTLCARWVEEEPPTEEPVVKGAGPGGWRGDSFGTTLDARVLYWAVSEGAKQILDLWIDNPGREFTAADLADHLGFDDDIAKLSGTLSSIGLRAKAANRAVPYHYERDGSTYWMDPEVAKTFEEVRKAGPIRRRSPRRSERETK